MRNKNLNYPTVHLFDHLIIFQRKTKQYEKRFVEVLVLLPFLFYYDKKEKTTENKKIKNRP